MSWEALIPVIVIVALLIFGGIWLLRSGPMVEGIKFDRVKKFALWYLIVGIAITTAVGLATGFRHK